MADPLHEHVKKRLNAIQRRRNFHPEWGAKQIQRADPRVHRDYGEFVALMGMAKLCGVAIPYRPSVGSPLAAFQGSEETPSVYFGRLPDSDTCKIGSSKNPQQRRKGLQTANQDRIDVRYTIPGAGREVEQALLRYTESYKSRGGGGTEWRDALTTQAIKEIIHRFKAEGPSFLYGPRLRRIRHGKAP